MKDWGWSVLMLSSWILLTQIRHFVRSLRHPSSQLGNWTNWWKWELWGYNFQWFLLHFFHGLDLKNMFYCANLYSRTEPKIGKLDNFFFQSPKSLSTLKLVPKGRFKKFENCSKGLTPICGKKVFRPKINLHVETDSVWYVSANSCQTASQENWESRGGQ